MYEYACNEMMQLTVVVGGGLDFAPMHAIHRYTRPNCNNVAITGVSHMSLALLNHWR